MADRILILGASARAAAASARRAGFTPFAVDLFADRDTQILCERVWRCPFDRYPEGLFELAKHAPPMPWMYTGGLENYPELVGELAKERELWGNGPEVLKRVRDPFELSSILSMKGLAHPEPRRSGETLDPAKRWLRKPICGSGGFGIRVVLKNEQSEPSADYYFQEFIPGPPMSAVFTATRSNPRMFSFCSQLIGTPWLHAKDFQYAGNLGPVKVEGCDIQDVYLRGFRLVDRVRMTGIFGVDFIPHADASYIIEVNPRYTASVEVHELTTGISAIRESQSLAFDSDRGLTPLARQSIVGKAIYYAPHRITFPASGPWDESLSHVLDVWRRPDFADIPHPGDIIEAGQPVITILTEADTESACLARLQSRAAELDRLFGFSPSPRTVDAHDE